MIRRTPPKRSSLSAKHAGVIIAGTMAFVFLFLGPEDRDAAMAQQSSVDEIEAQQAEVRERIAREREADRLARQEAEREAFLAWADDEDLVDDTSGFDPTPEEFSPEDGDEFLVTDDL